MIDLDAARRFVLLHARLLDRLRFAHRFDGGSPEAVVRALAAYRNADGGFGHGLEPDIRTPASQPIAALVALDVLDETGAADGPLGVGALDWLATVASPDGGVPFALRGEPDAPRAPWMAQTESEPSFHMTSAVTAAALRLAERSEPVRAHPWLDAAVGFCWERLPTDGTTSAYGLRYALDFLDVVPDRARAEAALERLRPHVPRGRGLPVAGGAEGEELPLTVIAPRPARPIRALFDAAAVERALDDLAAGQREDGGWDFDWLAWSPAVAWETRGRVTVEALSVLEANGRPARATK